MYTYIIPLWRKLYVYVHNSSIEFLYRGNSAMKGKAKKKRW